MDNNLIQEQQVLIDKENAFKYAFKQQILPAWTPVLTMKNSIPLFFATGMIFISIGIMLLSYSNEIQSVKSTYSDICGDLQQCTVTIDIQDTMKAPVFFYIELTNFYQNHRLYVDNKSVDQLAGQTVQQSTLDTDCSNAVTNSQMGKTLAYDGVTLLDQNANADPCGLIAKSLFNDTFTPIKLNNNIFEISNKNIAIPDDVDKLYKNNENWQSTQWIDKTDERFINWMRVAALPTFKKLWGRINTDLNGKYQLQIENNFSTSMFGGKKSIVFRTTNAFGGENSILATLYIVFGAISILISIGFQIKLRTQLQSQLNQNQ